MNPPARGDERGTVMVLTVIFLALVLALLSLWVNTALLFIARGNAQSYADAAALAALGVSTHDSRTHWSSFGGYVSDTVSGVAYPRRRAGREAGCRVIERHPQVAAGECRGGPDDGSSAGHVRVWANGGVHFSEARLSFQPRLLRFAGNIGTPTLTARATAELDVDGVATLIRR